MKKDSRGLRGIQQSISGRIPIGYSTVNFAVDNPDIAEHQFIYTYFVAPLMPYPETWKMHSIMREDAGLTKYVKDI